MKKLIQSEKAGCTGLVNLRTSDMEAREAIIDLIKFDYYQALQYNKSKLNTTFRKTYGRPLTFKDSQIGALIIKIKTLLMETKKESISQVVQEIRKYLGYKCSFFRDDSRLMPVPSWAIKKAHELVIQKASIVKVEDALYFE